MTDYYDLPSIGDCVVFNGTVCTVIAIDIVKRILTVRVNRGSYISYVYADDVDRLLLPDNKA